jgi:hypothetical protein
MTTGLWRKVIAFVEYLDFRGSEDLMIFYCRIALFAPEMRATEGNPIGGLVVDAAGSYASVAFWDAFLELLHGMASAGEGCEAARRTLIEATEREDLTDAIRETACEILAIFTTLQSI